MIIDGKQSSRISAHTVLLDKDGSIIAKDLRGEALQAKLDELLKQGRNR